MFRCKLNLGGATAITAHQRIVALLSSVVMRYLSSGKFPQQLKLFKSVLLTIPLCRRRGLSRGRVKHFLAIRAPFHNLRW